MTAKHPIGIRKLVIKNFKVLRDAVVELNPRLNVVVGDNETGKSTLLEAIHLVMSGQINGRGIQYELSPHHFNVDAVHEYFECLDKGGRIAPPSILIEAYLSNDSSLSRFTGTNNSLRENCPGLVIKIEFDEEYRPEYNAYIAEPTKSRTVPIEYYTVRWHSFDHNAVTSRGAPIKSTYIDTGLLRTFSSTDRYISNIINSVLEPKQKVELALAYRRLKDEFLQYDNVRKINSHLGKKKGDVSNKDLSVSMDMSSRSAWESILTPHLNDVPLSFAGKGEQSAVNMKLAIEGSNDAHIVLIEEPENHQSFPNVNSLINKIGEKTANQQIVIATHSSFVLNKLGVENVILFNRGKSAKLTNLTEDTKDYFMKLPGHDTLRLILAERAILVEGPSDELIVQKAHLTKYGCTALERNTDIISVQSLAFKRFLEIGVKLDLDIRVVTDNDGNVQRLRAKYQDFNSHEKIRIFFDSDESYPTLEPQLIKANSLDILNKVFGKTFSTEDELLNFMKNNKTDCALMIFDTQQSITLPRYINDAIE